MKLLILLFVALFGFFYLESTQIKTLTQEQCVSRSAMISKAQYWVDKHVPYDQSGRFEGYRTDCSGYVSACWQLSQPGPTTSQMLSYSHEITKSQLQPGDALLCPGTHIVLFGGWTDAGQTHYTAFEETRPGEGTVKRTTPYPYWSSTSCYKAVRSNTVC